MEFSKISEQNAWDAVADATEQVRRGESETALLAWFESQGVQIKQAIFPCLGMFDEGVYSGTLVTQDRRVIEYFVDLSCPEDGDFEDVTAELGPKDPSHPMRDLKDRITMALVYYDAQQSQAA
ncbi:MAG: hypothetical protein CVV10_07035 [Gammaproteobacteria bacterium HGW-Gammaproteobacteria-14]|nr:MAG: hypothetical protein CVV10_07035 [Gammaproteobacteria bacterium HGW-Gammaproteobacteria-14]